VGIYRKVEVRMWGDAKVMALSKPQPNGQSLWVALLTGEQTDIIPGLFKIGEAAFAEQLGWDLEGFRKAFAEVSPEGSAQRLAEADWKARVVFVPKAIHHNAPASPNVVTSWADAWERIPECALKLKAWRTLKAFLEGMSEGFRKAFEKACPKPLGIQEQEQEQETGAAAPRAPTHVRVAPGVPETPLLLPEEQDADLSAPAEPEPAQMACAGQPEPAKEDAVEDNTASGMERPAALGREETRPEEPIAGEMAPHGPGATHWWASRYPLTAQLLDALVVALRHPIAPPRLPAELAEIEGHVRRGGLQEAIAWCTSKALDREARYGRIGKLVYFLRDADGAGILAELPSKACAPGREEAGGPGRARVRGGWWRSCARTCVTTSSSDGFSRWRGGWTATPWCWSRRTRTTTISSSTTTGSYSSSTSTRWCVATWPGLAAEAL
jgi:hypothetical protein